MSLKQILVENTVKEKVGTVINASVTESNGSWWMLAQKNDDRKFLVHVFEKASPAAELLQVEEALDAGNMRIAVASLNANNAAVLRRFVKWTSPSACGTGGMSVGFSDWLGAAGACAAGAFTRRNMRPVLVDFTAEDSRILQRNFVEAMDTVAWGVFAAGYREGYGAQAAGLSSEEDIVKALLYGYSMIGLDCSEKINRSIAELADEAVDRKFFELQEAFCAAVHASYLNNEFKVGESTITFTESQLHRIILEYGEAIMHIQFLYNSYLKNTPWALDFELFLGGRGQVISPREHYLLANELHRNNIKLSALCLDALEISTDPDNDLPAHCQIAETFGHRLSFANAEFLRGAPADIAKALKGRVHFKLNNILWFSALQCIAANARLLYEQIFAAASLPLLQDPEDIEAAMDIVLSYKKLLSPGAGTLREDIRAFLQENERAYGECIEKNLEAFFKKL